MVTNMRLEMVITSEYRYSMKVIEFYINNADNLKSGKVSVDLHSEVVIPNNLDFISRVVGIPMYYWSQTHGNWWTDPRYSEGIRFLV